MAKPKTPPKPGKTPPKPDDEETPGEGDEVEDDEDEDGDRKINAIVTSRVNRALKPLSKQIADLAGKLAESLKARETVEDPDGDEGDEETTPPAKKPKAGTPDKKLTALEKRVKDAEERAANAEKAQQEQASKAKMQEENAVISAALLKSGITDPKVIKAITLSLREDELIVRDEETGKPRFKTVDKYGIEDFVDPEVGIGKWIKSDGKAFVPAVAASGSGAGGSGLSQAGPSTKLTKAEIGKLSPADKARIDIERASSGQPPLDQS